VFTVGREGRLLMSLFLVLLMTLYAALLLGSTVRAVLIAGFAGAVIWSVAAVNPRMYAWQPWEAGELFTLLVGRMLQRQRTLIDRLEAAREALAVQAVTEERRRIARELHDLAGHTLAAMLLHVTGARHVLDRDRADAERALREAEAVGRASMDQIRATVALLRTTETGVDAALPDGASLPTLVGEYQRAGVSITSTIAPDVLALSGPLAVALHRIGREALANIARHAPRNAVEFDAEIDADDRSVRLRISDHGRRAAPPDPTAGRFGLVGMGERARSLGGSLVAAPTADGWRVEATLPLSAETVKEIA
jgi:signal transduction histidine kinase